MIKEVIESIKNATIEDRLFICTGENGFLDLIIELVKDKTIKVTSLETFYEITAPVIDTKHILVGNVKDNTTTTVAEVVINPSFDDRSRNKVIHPDGGVTGSYEYDIYKINKRIRYEQ